MRTDRPGRIESLRGLNYFLVIAGNLRRFGKKAPALGARPFFKPNSGVIFRGEEKPEGRGGGSGTELTPEASPQLRDSGRQIVVRVVAGAAAGGGLGS